VRDEVRCEPMGRIQVRGIGHPVATFRVVDRHANLAPGRRPLHADLPHLKLEAEPERMSLEERRQAAALLRDAATRLAPSPGRRRPAQGEGRTEPEPAPALVAEPEG
jgi:adenylate cyclase